MKNILKLWTWQTSWVASSTIVEASVENAAGNPTNPTWLRFEKKNDSHFLSKNSEKFVLEIEVQKWGKKKWKPYPCHSLEVHPLLCSILNTRFRLCTHLGTGPCGIGQGLVLSLKLGCWNLLINSIWFDWFSSRTMSGHYGEVVLPYLHHQSSSSSSSSSSSTTTTTTTIRTMIHPFACSVKFFTSPLLCATRALKTLWCSTPRFQKHFKLQQGRDEENGMSMTYIEYIYTSY